MRGRVRMRGFVQRNREQDRQRVDCKGLNQVVVHGQNFIKEKIAVLQQQQSKYAPAAPHRACESEESTTFQSLSGEYGSKKQCPPARNNASKKYPHQYIFSQSY